MLAWGPVLFTLCLCLLLILLAASAALRIGDFLRDLVDAVRHHNDPTGEAATAEERASALLRDLLTEREYEQLVQRGYVEVTSPSNVHRRYRIPRDGGRVRVYEDGTAVHALCVGPAVSLPIQDVIVLHKLMILGNEQAYLARANRIPIGLW